MHNYNMYFAIFSASVTTERKFLITDLERLENINSHGNQQSSRGLYGFFYYELNTSILN